MLIRLCWLGLAIIHVLPAVALLKPSLLTTLYQVPADTTSFALLHHRAALFVGVCLACVWAALKPEVRQLTSVMVGLSMLSFLFLFVLHHQPQSLRLIAIVDTVTLPLLAIVTWQAFRRV